MKMMTTVLCTILVSSTVFASDVQVSPCSKNPEILLVEISGESAANIFRALAARINVKPVDLGRTLANNMNCVGLTFSENGDVTEAKCSYVKIGQKNVAFPQIDPGFSGEEVITCN